ncbi:hypothetical protein ACSVBT_08280 [Afipia sp. TerB]
MREIPLARDENTISPASATGSRRFVWVLLKPSRIGGRGRTHEAGLQNKPEHHNEKRRGDRIVQAVVLGDGIDDLHGTPDLKTGNPVAETLFRVARSIFLIDIGQAELALRLAMEVDTTGQR